MLALFCARVAHLLVDAQYDVCRPLSASTQCCPNVRKSLTNHYTNVTMVGGGKQWPHFSQFRPQVHNTATLNCCCCATVNNDKTLCCGLNWESVATVCRRTNGLLHGEANSRVLVNISSGHLQF